MLCSSTGGVHTSAIGCLVLSFDDLFARTDKCVVSFSHPGLFLNRTLDPMASGLWPTRT